MDTIPLNHFWQCLCRQVALTALYCSRKSRPLLLHYSQLYHFTQFYYSIQFCLSFHITSIKTFYPTSIFTILYTRLQFYPHYLNSSIPHNSTILSTLPEFYSSFHFIHLNSNTLSTLPEFYHSIHITSILPLFSDSQFYYFIHMTAALPFHLGSSILPFDQNSLNSTVSPTRYISMDRLHESIHPHLILHLINVSHTLVVDSNK